MKTFTSFNLAFGLGMTFSALISHYCGAANWSVVDGLALATALFTVARFLA